MAKKLGSDGRPIDVPTKPTRNDDAPTPKKNDGGLKGAGASSPPKARRRIDLGDEPTVAVGSRRQRGKRRRRLRRHYPSGSEFSVRRWRFAAERTG